MSRLSVPGHWFGLLRDHDFRLLFASTTVSEFGVRVSRLAFPLLAVTTLDASPFEVGLVATFSTAPFLLVGLFAGVHVDRVRRRSILVLTNLARALLLAAVPVVWLTGALAIGHLYLVAFLVGVCNVYFETAHYAYVPHLIGRADLVEGNSKIESVRATAQVAGPAIAGNLIKLLGAPVALLVDALALTTSAALITRIRKREPDPKPRRGTGLLREMVDGLRFVLTHRLLRALVACTGTFNLFFAAYNAMLIVYLERVLGLHAGEIGVALSIAGVGGLVGALVARRLSGWLGQGPSIWLSAAVAPPFALLFPLLAAPGWRVWAAAAAWAVVMAGIVVYNVNQVSLRQAVTPDDLLGRMSATIRTLVWGLLTFGALGGGILGDLVGVRLTLTLCGAGLCVAFLFVFLSPLRRMRTLPAGPDPTVDIPAEAAEAVSSDAGSRR